jgi:hypothetical protein
MRSWKSCLALVFGLAWSIGVAAQEPEAVASPVVSDESEGTPEASGEARRELRTVEEAVHDLKERVFRTKATLLLLKELVIESATLGSGVAVWHINDLPSAYQVDTIQYFLDGKSVYAWTAGGAEAAVPRELEIRDQAVGPGQHTLLVTMVLRGNGRQVFTYLDDYRFKIQSNYAFEVEEGKLTTVRVRALATGGVKKSFVERPTIVYEERSEQYQVE